MLRVVEPVPALNAAERFALATLLDLSRVLETDADESVGLRVAGAADSVAIARCRADGWGIRTEPGLVTVARSTLRLAADLAGVVSEQRTNVADRFGRVPPEVNALVAAGLEREPVVNRVAVALRDAVIAAARGPVALVTPWPDGRRWALAMSHDLDVASLWPGFTMLRLLELLRKGDAGRSLRVVASAASTVFGDPILAAARRIIETERAFGVRATWFVITGTPSFTTMRAGDVTYTPESARPRHIIALARDAAAEVGLHGSFETYVDASRFLRQRERLRGIAGCDIAGVRQHFLRMRPGVTHRAMREAGFSYDSTHGFPDRNGFRLGVADVTRVWDDAEREVLTFDEVPFLWMDRALSKYRGVEDPAVWIEDALEIAGIVRAVEGVWNGIWHPNLTSALGFPGAPQAFDALVRGLSEQSPWSACMSDIVAWRRARRDARAAGLDAAGRVRLRADARVTLEDGDGKPFASVAA